MKCRSITGQYDRNCPMLYYTSEQMHLPEILMENQQTKMKI